MFKQFHSYMDNGVELVFGLGFDGELINLSLGRHPVFFHIFGVPSEEEELGLGWLLMLDVIKSLHLLIVKVLYLNST